MLRPFDFNDTGRVMRVLRALLPTDVSVLAQAANGGWVLNVTLCGKTACEVYQFKPTMSDRELLALSMAWETGEFVAPPDGEDKRLMAAIAVDIHLTTRNDFIAWARDAKHGAKVVYFKGLLSQFRYDAPRRIVALQRLSDEARPSNPTPVEQRVELADLQERLSLLEAVNNLQKARVVEMVQTKAPDGSGATYYAVKI